MTLHVCHIVELFYFVNLFQLVSHDQQILAYITTTTTTITTRTVYTLVLCSTATFYSGLALVAQK